MITMADSVTPAKLPRGQDAYAGYVDGRFPSFAGVLARFYPRAHCLSITVLGGHAACLDVEPGNPVAASQAGAWVRAMIRAGQWRPCVYADRSDMPAVTASLHGVPRGSYRLWLADPDGVAELPAGFDAKQYAFRGGYDLSVCADDFFALRATPRRRRRPPRPHRKVIGSTVGAALGVLIVTVLQTVGVPVTGAEASAISTLTSALTGYATPA